MKFAVIGEGVIDRFFVSGGSKDVIGGSGLNTAIAAKLAGVEVNWVSLHSTDTFGQDILDFALKFQVLPDEITKLNFPTPLVEIQLTENGSPLYAFHMKDSVDWQWDAGHLNRLSQYDVLHLTSLSAVQQPGADAIYNFLLTKPQTLLTTFDPNARPSAIELQDQDFAKRRIEDIVRLVDVVKVSDEDLGWFSNQDVRQTAIHWSTLGPAFVVVTLGDKGALLFQNGTEVTHIPGTPVEVVDTVGAGDTIMGWILRSISHYGAIPPKDILVDNLRLAVKAAAITCSRQGCKPPTESEILES